jgi:RNA polymerase sigma-70 factor (ECF subfamily)
LTTTRTGAGQLFREHAEFVAGFLLRVGAPRAEVDDLLQEVFLVAHRRGGFVAGEAKATTWLAEIALRVWSNRRRSKRRRPTEPDDVDRRDERADVEQTVEATRALERAQRCIDELDDDHRAVFVLFEIEGEPCAEIAAALHVPVGTVYRRLHTARIRFRETYARITGEGRDGI